MIINSNGGRQLNSSNNNNNSLKVGDKIRIINPNKMWDAEIYFNGYSLDRKDDFMEFGLNSIPDFDSEEYFKERHTGLIYYEEDTSEHFNSRKYCISIDIYDNNGIKFNCSSNVFTLGEISQFAEKIEENIEEEDIQDSSLSTTQKVYQGWEIMKLAQETDEYMEFDFVSDGLGKSCGLKVGQGSILYNNRCIDDYPHINCLLNYQFILKQQKLVTFDEARKSGKSFKYKDWKNYSDIFSALNKLKLCASEKEVNQMLDEKAWVIEE